MTTQPRRSRHSRASFAVIERYHNGVRQWLVQWNHAWKAFNLVGGHKRENESYRRCLIRELGEELGLKQLVDYVVDPAPAHRLRYTSWSKRAREQTQYQMELFRVRLTEEAEQRVNAIPANRWLTDDEIVNQLTYDGQPVSETIFRLLESMGLAPNQDSSL